MTLHPRSILWGTLTGLLGGAASCGLIAGMGLAAGTVPAVLAATVAGACGALLLTRANIGQAAAILESLAEDDPWPRTIPDHSFVSATASSTRARRGCAASWTGQGSFRLSLQEPNARRRSSGLR